MLWETNQQQVGVMKSSCCYYPEVDDLLISIHINTLTMLLLNYDWCEEFNLINDPWFI